MRELAVLTGEIADSLKDDETGLIIKKEFRKAKPVAVIYLVGENVESRITDEMTEAPPEPNSGIDEKPTEEPLAAS